MGGAKPGAGSPQSTQRTQRQGRSQEAGAGRCRRLPHTPIVAVDNAGPPRKEAYRLPDACGSPGDWQRPSPPFRGRGDSVPRRGVRGRRPAPAKRAGVGAGSPQRTQRTQRGQGPVHHRAHRGHRERSGAGGRATRPPRTAPQQLTPAAPSPTIRPRAPCAGLRACPETETSP